MQIDLALDLRRQRPDRPRRRCVATRVLDEVREPEDGRPDLLGAAQLALGIGLLTLGIVKGPDGAGPTRASLAAFAAADALVAAFSSAPPTTPRR